jgi:hypothetical protein
VREARALERCELVRLEGAGIVDEQSERPEGGGRRDELGRRLGVREIAEDDAGAPAAARVRAIAAPMRRPAPVTSAAPACLACSGIRFFPPSSSYAAAP